MIRNLVLTKLLTKKRLLRPPACGAKIGAMERRYNIIDADDIRAAKELKERTDGKTGK